MTEAVDKLRNIVFIGHGGSGKTSLAEIMLFKTGVTNRLGRVEEGNTAMDFEPEEIKRQASISSGFHQFNWKKQPISIIDTPGDQNFFTDTKMCMQGADSAVVVIDAVDGVKVQSEQAWALAEEFNQPRLIFVNKMDKERADFGKTVEDAVACLEPKPIVVQLPIGAEAGFTGIIDLIAMKAYTYDNEGKGKISDIPEDLKSDAEAERDSLIENIVEADDKLMERYLEGDSISDEELYGALKKGVIAGTIIPILCGSAIKDIGIDLLMDAVAAWMPSPADKGAKIGIDPKTKEEIKRLPDPNEPFSGFVFKTIADPFAGRLTIFRIVSGKLGSDGNFYNCSKEVRERFNQLLLIAGKEQKPIDGAGPGAIVAVAKLKETLKPAIPSALKTAKSYINPLNPCRR